MKVFCNLKNPSRGHKASENTYQRPPLTPKNTKKATYMYKIVRKQFVFLARFGVGRSFAKNLNLCVQTEKKE